MRIDVLTLFPEMFDGVINSSIIKRTIDKDIVDINIHDFREYSNNKHKKVDDTPYGGGAGMVIAVQPIVDCLKTIPNYQHAYKIITTASGNCYNQKKAQTFSKINHMIIICGHYEGIDERIINYIDEEISIGDYILTGGEVASLAIIDSVVRLLPNAIKQESQEEESFSNSLLEYPHYTKPAEFDGHHVPEVLLSGNHQEIRKYRRFMSLKKTFLTRPDLINSHELTSEDNKFLHKIKNGEGL